MTPALFEQFGFGKWLRHERTRAHLRAQRRRDAARKRERKIGAGAGQLLTQLTDKLAAAQAKAAARGRLSESDRRAELKRAVIIDAGEIKAAHPDWDRDRCFRIARNQLFPPA
ncbi:hypothetical protein [Burkholderia gladioli]|uniref:hypothetical protein n=1 Tax=Burkholderia gladioli TaxID=28095 RepID=UPI001FC86114|nr:hypothetical protein [Burkholderia gladioli]